MAKTKAPEAPRQEFVMGTGAKARELVVSEQTVRNLAARGELEYIKTVGGERLFKVGQRPSRRSA
jgi:hypothetical protein